MLEKISKIRRILDKETGKPFFSIVDFITATVKTSNPRNYWKVLKNRFKKEHFELVTKCKPRKMLSNDGKYYLTDTADIENLLKIAEFIPKLDIRLIKEGLLRSIANNDYLIDSSSPDEVVELQIDAKETKSEIQIVTMIAGVSPEDINIHLYSKKIVISGKRNLGKFENYFLNELRSVSFLRTISLPCSIETNIYEKIFENGKLTITLKKLT